MCVFCAVIEGTAPAEVVYADVATTVFLDNRPVFHGHCLVVPKDHYDTMDDLPDGLVAPLFATVKRVAAGVQAALGADGTFIAVNNNVSQSVPHLHVHVVPRRFKDGLRGFFWPRSRYGAGEMAAIAQLIREQLESAPAR
ncbi:MAG TPA: HIT family protein [Actinomycetota bacterium]|nr:HIT family protein [Actinomycetota bacterium]